MPDTNITLIEISFEREGTKSLGRLFINNNNKIEFEGDVEESARVFFEVNLKEMCENYFIGLVEKYKKKYPLFHWKENNHA